MLAFQGNRYSQEDMLEVINLYLTRNSYRAFREILVFPPMCHYCVWLFQTVGCYLGALECEKTVKTVFNPLNDGQNDCFLSFDTIHIKPGLQYQGKYVPGNVLKNTSIPTPANVLLAVIINPSYVVNSVLEVIQSARGRVFSLLCDQLLVNEKPYKMFHETFDSLDVTSIVHPCKNSKFEVTTHIVLSKSFV